MFNGTVSIHDWASINIFSSAAMVMFHNPFEIAFTVPLTLREYGFPLRFFKGSTTSLWFSAVLLERWRCQDGWQLMNWMLNSSSPWFFLKPFLVLARQIEITWLCCNTWQESNPQNIQTGVNSFNITNVPLSGALRTVV